MLRPKTSSPQATTVVNLPRVALRQPLPAPPPQYEVGGEREETDSLDETEDDGVACQTPHELRPLGARMGLHEAEPEVLALGDGRDGGSRADSDTAPTVPATPRLRQRG